MGTMVRITYFGMEGEGPTVTAAKQHAGAKIERALSGDYTPLALVWRGHVAIVAREPRSGWGYRLVHVDGARRQSLYLNGDGDGNPVDAERAARRHLAQNAWDGSETDEASIIEHEQDRREFRSWAAHSVAYKRARDAGATDEQAYRVGCAAAEGSIGARS